MIAPALHADALCPGYQTGIALLEQGANRNGALPGCGYRA